MSGGHWGYMSEPMREMAGPLATVFEALADLEHIVDWSESGDTGRSSYPDDRRAQFADAVARALDTRGDDRTDDVVLAEIAAARLRLDDYLSGREHERTRADILARVGREIGPWEKKDTRGAEAEAYDRLVTLFDALESSGRLGRW